jgi:hypothetical protein
MSSTNNMCVVRTKLSTQIPFIFPLLLASLMRKLSPLSTNNKRNGDKEHPCSSPLEALKKPEGDPLINTIKETSVKRPIIYLTLYKFIPFYKKNKLS